MSNYQPPLNVTAPVYALDVPRNTDGVIVYFSYKDVVPVSTGTVTRSVGKKFVDLSKWQKKIDFGMLNEVGKVDTIALRSSYGKTIDENFAVNWPQSKNIPNRLVYHYFQNEISVETQTDIFLQSMGNDINGLIYALDIEDTDPPIDLDQCLKWFERIEKETDIPGVLYTGQSVYRWDTAPDWVYHHLLWKAQYSRKCLPLSKWGYPDIWQFSSRGRLPGLVDDVTIDLNIVWDGDSEPILDWWYRGITTEELVNGTHKNNFIVSALTSDPIEFFDKPNGQGKVVKSLSTKWPMTVTMITLDGWLRVHNDGKNDWWVSQEKVKLA